MSHFTVLCVGDVDYNMAPFHEFECDGYNDEFIETINITDDMKKDFVSAKENYMARLKQYAQELIDCTDAQIANVEKNFNDDVRHMFKGETFREFLNKYHSIAIIEPEDVIDIEGACKYQYAIDLGNDDFAVYRRTNPNSRYDYYVEGGRWDNGILLLKEKGKNGEDRFVNSATKGEIDFEEMFKRSERNARKNYRDVIAILGKVPQVQYEWADLIEKMYSVSKESSLTMDEVEAIYENQPDVKLFREKRKELEKAAGYLIQVEQYACSENEYVRRNSINAVTYAIVRDRQYCSKGDMGWWGISSNDKEPFSWNEEYKRIVDSIPDDEVVTVLDCHV